MNEPPLIHDGWTARDWKTQPPLIHPEYRSSVLRGLQLRVNAACRPRYGSAHRAARLVRCE